MKALFLAERVVAQNGVTGIRLVDINGGDSLNDFRAGSPKGDLQINVFGDQTLFEAGKPYLIEISEFVEGQETATDSGTGTAATTLKAVPADYEQPVTEEFEGKITITHDGERLMIAIKPSGDAEQAAENEGLNTPAKESGADTNTQAHTDAANNANGSGADTNTQASAGASTADSSNEGANQAENTDNPDKGVV